MPDSCCKTVVARCGLRAHPSNIYKVEVSTLAPAGAYRGPSRPSRGPQKVGSGRQAGGSGVHLFIGQKTTVQELHRSPQNPGDKQLLLGDSETSWHAPQVTREACWRLKGYIPGPLISGLPSASWMQHHSQPFSLHPHPHPGQGACDLLLPYREAASLSWSSSWPTTCCSWGQWASGWPACR